ncbi:unnamed protein product [Blepharisma stoltei]|uniref:KHA domain-containing protein n=1 Tax=Blepharisma stoltei TaxID=1481888 RepID=A0AAU9IL62_9CILI|nr:unnamed protein product [Blepharisma stoltei]
MVDQARIRVALFKNEHHPTISEQILIDPRMEKEELLNLCSEKLGIRAKKIFNEAGVLLNSFGNLSDGAHLYISQGENFQVAISESNQAKQSKKYVIAMLGAAAVGKSAVTMRYVSNKFVRDYDPTIENYYTKTTQIEGEPTVISILDTAGMEDYYPLIDDWIDKKDGFVLVYSVDVPDSLNRLKYFHEKILHRYSHQGNKGPVIVMAANKVDLPTRNISAEEGRKFAENLGVRHIEVSAATSAGIDEVFASIVKELRSRRIVDRPSKKEPWYKKCTLL